MSDIIPLGPRTLGAVLKPSDSFVVVATTLGLRMPDFEQGKKHFTFRRRKRDGVWGVEVGLYIGEVWMNLTYRDVAPFARSKAAARDWAYAFAKQYGFPAVERVKYREPKQRPPVRLTVIDGGQP